MSDSIELFERERFILQREREMSIDTDDPQFIKSLKYGIRRDYNEWSLPRSLGDIQLFNKKLNCSITIAANFSSNLSVNLPKDPNQRRLKDRIPEERKYVIDSHNFNTLIKAPFGVVTAFPDDPTPMFYSYHPSESVPSTSYDLTYHTSSSCSNLSQPEPVETNSIAIQTEVKTWDSQTDFQLTASWSTESAIAEFEQQNKNFVIDVNNWKVSLRCANRSRARAKPNADRAESKLEISEKVTSDLFEENKEAKQQLEEAISKAETLQYQLLEAIKRTFCLNKNWMAMVSQTRDFKNLQRKRQIKTKTEQKSKNW